MAVLRPKIKFNRGSTYTFDVSDPTNAGHPFRFTADSGTSVYDSGVTITGSPGSDNASVSITVPGTAPSLLNYYCDTHGIGMGNHVLVVGSAAAAGPTFYKTYQLDSSDGPIAASGKNIKLAVDTNGDIQHISQRFVIPGPTSPFPYNPAAAVALDGRNIYRYALTETGDFKWGKKRIPDFVSHDPTKRYFEHARYRGIVIDDSNNSYTAMQAHNITVNNVGHSIPSTSTEVTKWNSAGDILWTRHLYDSGLIDSAAQYNIDSANGFYKTKAYDLNPYNIVLSSTGDPIIYSTQENNSLLDPYHSVVMKLDQSAGDLLWARKLRQDIGDTGDNHAYGLAADNKGNVFCSTTIELRGANRLGSGSVDIKYNSIIKLDSSGNKVWSNTYGSPHGFIPEDSIGISEGYTQGGTDSENATDSVLMPRELIYDIVTDDAGDVYAYGHMNTAADSDSWDPRELLVKFDADDGHIVWQIHGDDVAVSGEYLINYKLQFDEEKNLVLGTYHRIQKYNTEGKKLTSYLVDFYKPNDANAVFNGSFSDMDITNGNIYLGSEFGEDSSSQMRWTYDGDTYGVTVSLPSEEDGKSYRSYGGGTVSVRPNDGVVHGHNADTAAQMDILTGGSTHYGPLGTLDIMPGNHNIISTDFTGTDKEANWTPINSMTIDTTRSATITARPTVVNYFDSATVEELYEENTIPEYARKLVKSRSNLSKGDLGTIAVSGENLVDIFAENDSDIFTSSNKIRYDLDGTHKFVYSMAISDHKTNRHIAVRAGTDTQTSTSTKIYVFDQDGNTTFTVDSCTPYVRQDIQGQRLHIQDIDIMGTGDYLIYTCDSAGTRVVKGKTINEQAGNRDSAFDQGDQEFVLTPPVTHPNDPDDTMFGHTVSGDGPFLCIAAPLKTVPAETDSDDYGDAGGVHVYVQQDEKYGVRAEPDYRYTIYSPGLGGDDISVTGAGGGFGYNMVQQGNILAVYAGGFVYTGFGQHAQANVGQVYVFALEPTTYKLLGTYSDFNAIGYSDALSTFDDDLQVNFWETPRQKDMLFGRWSNQISLDWPYLSMHGNNALHLDNTDFRRFEVEGDDTGVVAATAGNIAVFDLRDNAHVGTIYHPGPLSEAHNHGNRELRTSRFGAGHAITSEGTIYASSAVPAVAGQYAPWVRGGKVRKLLPGSTKAYSSKTNIRSTHSLVPAGRTDQIVMTGDDGTWAKGDAWTIEFWMKVDTTGTGSNYDGSASIVDTDDDAISIFLFSEEVRAKLLNEEGNISPSGTNQYLRTTSQLIGVFSEGVDSDTSTYDGDLASRWHHIAIVYENLEDYNPHGKGFVSLYLDGRHEARDPTQRGVLAGTPTWIFGGTSDLIVNASIFDFAIHGYKKYSRTFVPELDIYRPEITDDTKVLLVGTASGPVDLCGNASLSTVGTVNMSTDIPDRGDLKDVLKFSRDDYRDNSEERKNDPSSRGAPQ